MNLDFKLFQEKADKALMKGLCWPWLSSLILLSSALSLGPLSLWAEEYYEEVDEFYEAPGMVEPFEEDRAIPPEDPEGLRRARPRGRPGRGAPPVAQPEERPEPSFTPPPPPFRPRGSATSSPPSFRRGGGPASSGQVKFRATGTQREYPPRPKSRAAQKSKGE